MRPRAIDDPSRAVSPLELLFDLCFVVAIASDTAKLHHAISENHAAAGVVGYLLVFFAIWWAWMNFTWFAAGYDTDDLPFRLMTFAQIAGVLMISAGVGPAFDGDSRLLLFGFGVMRFALAAQLIRAAVGDPARRRGRLRSAAGITVAQFGWMSLLAVPPSWRVGLSILMVLVELAVPVWAEQGNAPRHPWHPRHIAERYQLFCLIVLGESVFAATTTISQSLGAGADSFALAGVAFAGLVIIFSMWWLYFAKPAHPILLSTRAAFVWAYGHFVIFASAAAVGAALSVAVDQVTGKTSAPGWLVVAIPTAIFAISVWLLHIRPHARLLPSDPFAAKPESTHTEPEIASSSVDL